MTYLLADIGGTWIRLARSSGKKLDACVTIPTPRNWKRAKQDIVLAVGQLMNGHKISRAVFGLPGIFDRDHTKLLFAPNLRGWERQSLQKDLQFILRCPVTLENDAALGALGEAVYGAGQGQRIVGYIAVGTGIGGARIVEQQINASVHGFEPGHHLIGSQEWEKIVGGAALARKFGSDWKRRTKKEWHWIADQLVPGLVNATMFWSPDVLVLGGGVIDHGRLPWPRLRRELAQKLKRYPHGPQLKRGQLQHEAGLFGGLALVRKN